MEKKACVGCLQDVEDVIESKGIGTICKKCCFDINKIPQELLYPRKCQNCGGETNPIGAFIADVEREKWKNGIFPFPSRGEQKRFNTPRLWRGEERAKRVPIIPRGFAPRDLYYAPG